MPSSKEFFDIPDEPKSEMFDKLADSKDNIDGKEYLDGMFALAGGYPHDPSTKEMEEAKLNAIKFNKYVVFEGIDVKVFQLPKEREAYIKFINKLYKKQQLKEWIVTQHDRKFINREGINPYWLVYIEYYKYKLKVDKTKEIEPAT